MKPGCAVLVLATGCWTAPVAPPPAATTVRHAGELVVTRGGVGPIRASTPATERALRALLPAYRVRTEELGGDRGVVFDVLDGTEQLLYVVPIDDDRLFNVAVTSPRVRVADRSWRVGAPFSDAGVLDRCECLGEGEEQVVFCYPRGGVIAFDFRGPCDPDGPLEPASMLGHPIYRMVWNPRAWSDDYGAPAGE